MRRQGTGEGSDGILLGGNLVRALRGGGMGSGGFLTLVISVEQRRLDCSFAYRDKIFKKALRTWQCKNRFSCLTYQRRPRLSSERQTWRENHRLYMFIVDWLQSTTSHGHTDPARRPAKVSASLQQPANIRCSYVTLPTFSHTYAIEERSSVEA